MVLFVCRCVICALNTKGIRGPYLSHGCKEYFGRFEFGDFVFFNGRRPSLETVTQFRPIGKQERVCMKICALDVGKKYYSTEEDMQKTKVYLIAQLFFISLRFELPQDGRRAEN